MTRRLTWHPLLFLGCMLAFAQQEGRKHEPHRPEGRPPGRDRAERQMNRQEGAPPDRARPVQDRGPERAPVAPRLPHKAEAPSRTFEDMQRWHHEGAWHRDAWAPRTTWSDHRARRWASEHRTWTQRGGYLGPIIPQPSFQARFGVDHAFRLRSRPVVYEGYPRFWFHGYWFFIVDPWPEDWMDDWYMNDDVYIDYRWDGYYLFNRRHPGVAMALMVSL